MDRIQIFLLLLVAMVALWLLWQGTKQWLRRSIQVEASSLSDERPTLLYFGSDSCAPCRLQQTPIVASLRQKMGEEAHFEEYDAVACQDLARKFRVLTVPTTVVLSPCGDVVAVNHGLAPAETLKRQLDEAANNCMEA